MKVLNLQCGQSHDFEGWFGSENDFQSQLTRGLVACPLCGNMQIIKMPSAPRLNFGATAPNGVQASTRPAPTPGGEQAGNSQVASRLDANGASDGRNKALALSDSAQRELDPADAAQLQAAYLKLARHVVATTEDVGDGFAEEARKIHYGETEERGIRGKATRKQALELAEEGIGVVPFALPEHLKGTLQ